MFISARQVSIAPCSAQWMNIFHLFPTPLCVQVHACLHCGVLMPEKVNNMLSKSIISSHLHLAAHFIQGTPSCLCLPGLDAGHAKSESLPIHYVHPSPRYERHHRSIQRLWTRHLGYVGCYFTCQTGIPLDAQFERPAAVVAAQFGRSAAVVAAPVRRPSASVFRGIFVACSDAFCPCDV